MPEAFIIKRWDAELAGLTDDWRHAFTSLNKDERKAVTPIIVNNKFHEDWNDYPSNIQKVLEFYLMKDEDIPSASKERKERWINDFAKSCPENISDECQRILDQIRK